MATDRPPLEKLIRGRITASGPMPVGKYMALCLTHPEYGYYTTRDPFGARGDFITAPEVSQMFGELIGLWAATVWKQMGEPIPVRLIELGPGRGTMMLDALRAATIVPEFRRAITLHLVEISPVLEQRQRQAFKGLDISVDWYTALEQVPPGPSIILANEFFDALPAQQAIMCADGWHERVIRISDAGHLQFSHARDPIPLFEQMLPPAIRDANIGDIFEWRSDQIALEIGRRVAHSEGAALVIDYGHAVSATGNTFQAVGSHRFTDPLTSPGLVDLTAHLDFQALMQAAESMDARIYGPVDQGLFLERLGIEQRAEMLKSSLAPDKATEVDIALARLTSSSRTGMGRLFKAVGFAHAKLGPLPAFES